MRAVDVAANKEREVFSRWGNKKKCYLVTKRVFDIVVSSLALLVLLLPMLIVAVLIRLETPGSAIYTQDRLGKDGKAFVLYKFRSMYQDAEKDGPQWATKGDPRCTKIGRFIRYWHIDELPQLFNVLLGDMSIVGPRPERAFFYDEFVKEVPDFRVRLSVPQGLTCIAQVNGCYDLTPSERIAYDKEYMNKQSLWMDFICIMQTFVVLFNHKGAR